MGWWRRVFTGLDDEEERRWGEPDWVDWGRDAAPRREFRNGAPGGRYDGFILREGDRDDMRIWDSAQQDVEIDGLVARLQRDLRAVGCYNGAADGFFGPLTERAVKRFQWNRRTVDRRLSAADRDLEPIPANPRMAVDGVVGPMTTGELDEWVSGGYLATGSLRIAPLSLFPNFSDQGALRAVKPGLGGNREMVVHVGFLTDLALIDEAAGANNIRLRLNSVFRISGEPITGA
ncbi:MAG: peptidoglycan-binding domain-containing protein, partial [Pseudomonadota bacterium]